MKGTKVLLYKDKLTGHKESIVGVYSPQGPKGGILVSVSRDGRLKVWNLFERDFILKRVLLKNMKATEDVGQKIDVAPMDMIDACLFSEKTVFCGYADGTICAWNMKVGLPDRRKARSSTTSRATTTRSPAWSGCTPTAFAPPLSTRR